MADFVNKQYQFTNGDDLAPFFEALGASSSLSKNASSEKTVTELKKNADGSFTLSSGTSGGAQVYTFQPGVELEEDSHGVKLYSTFTVESNKVTQNKKLVNGRVITVVRDFSPTQLITTTTVTGWDGKNVRYFEAI